MCFGTRTIMTITMTMHYSLRIDNNNSRTTDTHTVYTRCWFTISQLWAATVTVAPAHRTQLLVQEVSKCTSSQHPLTICVLASLRATQATVSR